MIFVMVFGFELNVSYEMIEKVESDVFVVFELIIMIMEILEIMFMVLLNLCCDLLEIIIDVYFVLFLLFYGVGFMLEVDISLFLKENDVLSEEIMKLFSFV